MYVYYDKDEFLELLARVQDTSEGLAFLIIETRFPREGSVKLQNLNFMPIIVDAATLSGLSLKDEENVSGETDVQTEVPQTP